MVYIGLFHQRQELTGIGRQRLHVATLALGINGVEGQGGFPRARQPGYDDEFVAGEIEIDVLKVVGAGTPDADRVHAVFQRAYGRVLYARRSTGIKKGFEFE